MGRRFFGVIRKLKPRAERPELGGWAGLLGELGSLGGRLGRALGGEEGAEAQTAAAAALRRCLLYWSDSQCRDQPAEVPAWVLGEAVPGLLGLAGQREAETAARVAAVKALGSRYLRRCGAQLDAALQAHVETLADCLYQEPLISDLSQATVVLLSDLGAKLPSPDPLLRSVARLVRYWRLPNERSPAPFDAQRLDQARRLLYSHPCSGGLPLPEVLGDEALSRELALVVERQGAENFLQRVAESFPLSDARVGLFLRQGGAGFLVRQLRYKVARALPGGVDGALYAGQAGWAFHGVAKLAEGLGAVLEPSQLAAAAVGLRARLLRDAGLSDLLPSLRRLSDGHDQDLLRNAILSLLDRYDAALAQPLGLSRLPAFIVFPDR